jgi:O-acetyl-ADP-ribose deacetylase (regulator of RNase III)
MITYVIGDIFHSPAKVLVNTVNTKGVMGKGLAKDFKAIYPEMFRAYQRLCDAHKLDVGQLHLFRTANKWILNFPTKRDWKHPSKTEYIEAGLKTFANAYGRMNVTSIAFPQLGCGHGELDWEADVRPLMEKHLASIPIQIFVHLYRKDVFPKEHQDLVVTKTWLRSEPESLGFQEVWEDLVATVAATPRLTTESGRSVAVAVTTVPDEGVGFVGQESVHVAKETWLDLWQYFRSAGFLSGENLPDELRAYADEVLALLARLPYVTPVELARGRATDGRKFTPALQLTPRALQDEPLFRTPSETVVHV